MTAIAFKPSAAQSTTVTQHLLVPFPVCWLEFFCQTKPFDPPTRVAPPTDVAHTDRYVSDHSLLLGKAVRLFVRSTGTA
jgi:hypothetical protein